MDEEPHQPYYSSGRAVSWLLFAGLLLATMWLPRLLVAILILAFPLVVVVGLALWFGGDWLAARRKGGIARERLAGGLCESCGYDVRGIDDRCPECGTPIWRPRDPLTGKRVGPALPDVPPDGASTPSAAGGAGPTMRNGE
jgi:hypothetical protein